jgi:hypothetical protein
MIIFNEETKDIIKETHICYYVNRIFNKICLYEIYEKLIKHPEAKEYACVIKIDTRLVEEYQINDPKAHKLILLESAQVNIAREKIKMEEQ